MAQAASQKRESAATKLEDSVRQLKRYLLKEERSQRNLVLKSEKVDVDKEELMAKHMIYAEKAGISLQNAEMKDFIEDKIDDAVDAIDQATDEIAKLEAAESVQKEDEKCLRDVAAAKLRAKSGNNVVKDLIERLNAIITKEEPTADDARKAEGILEEIKERGKELSQLYDVLKCKFSTEVQMQEYADEEELTQNLISERRIEANSFISIHKATGDEIETGTVMNTSRASTSSAGSRMRMERMKAPVFSGDIRDFARFKGDFENMVMESYNDETHQVYVMKKECLKGEALDLVRNLATLEAIWERLTEKYGDSIEIVESIIKDIEGVTISGSNQDRGVIELIEKLERGIQDLTFIGKRNEIANLYTVKLIEKKLPKRVLSKWYEKVQRDEDNRNYVVPPDKFVSMLAFLKTERKITEKLVQQSQERNPPKEEVIKKKGNKYNMYNKAEGGEKNKHKCIIHPEAYHLTRKCSEFLKKTVDERATTVKDLNACQLCLSTSHIGAECPWKAKWQPCDVEGCGQYHSRTLHGNTVINMHLQASVKYENVRVLLLMQEIPDKVEKAFTFWDNGSMISLVARQYARKRKLVGVAVSYDLTTINNVTTVQHTILYDVPIVNRRGEIINIKAYEIESICDEVAFFNERVKKLFKNIKMGEIARPKSSIDLLIGADNMNIHPKQDKNSDKLVLFKSLFGTGKVLGGSHPSLNIKGTDRINAFAKMVAFGKVNNFRVESRCHCSPKNIDFFTAENLGVTNPPRCNKCLGCRDCTFEAHHLSQEDQRELDVIKEQLTLDPISEKWIAKYPYKFDPSTLEDNESQADVILQRLEKQLSRNEKAKKSYCEQFEDAIQRGVYKLIPEEELNSYKGPKFYITQFAVENEHSLSTPVRIVSNSSLKFKGVSFNDILMKGPNVLGELFCTQLNFRTHLVAAIADIKKMYHSVSTTVLERHLRRVKWRGVNLDIEPKIYGTEVVQFGDKPAAAITATAIKQTAELYEYIDPVAAEKLKNDSYVDDIATGDKTTAQAKMLMKNIEAILAKGGFHLKGFVLSGDDTESSVALMGSGEVGRVLGVGWCPATDEICVVVRIYLSKKKKGVNRDKEVKLEDIPAMIQEKLTRSIILAVTNSIYDLYGFFIPFTICMKVVIRETYKKELKLGWKDDIPRELKEQWIHSLRLLKEAESLRFKRCISFPNSVGNPELVVFNDGSDLAMCAVVYIRWKLDTGKFAVQFVCAKAKVAPLERITTPRVEMNSAVLAVRLAKTVRRSCRDLKFDHNTHISDSMCTIASLSKDSTALKEYMGNRVSEINKETERKQWVHTESANNPADRGTRLGATLEDVSPTSKWQLSSDWVKKEKSEWPVTYDIGPEHIPEEELRKPKICSHLTSASPIIDPSSVRSYDRLMRITARVFMIFESKTFKNSKEPSPAALEKSERYWIDQSMKLTREKLEKGQLDSLRPKINENNTVVLSTRALEGLKRNYDTFPILTSKDPLARLWVRKMHFEGHTGATKTAAKCRKKFWIVRVTRLARSMKSSCYVCCLVDKMLAKQQMAPLPDHRLAPSPPFYTTSIDLFGPYLIKDTVKKRTKMKVWGFIATCAVSRAVHLDITDSYGTDSILQTLRKFKLMRGCPSEIISDQGSQLVAASKDVADLTKNWNWGPIAEWASSKSIKWTVVPAEAHHHNGLSESLIKSVKRSITHVVGENVLSFSELQLAMFEVANILNCRPLGITSDSDPEDPTPITPNGLLYGKCDNEVPQGPFNSDLSIKFRFEYVQSIVDDWWTRWYARVLPSLVPSYKWMQKHRNVKVGDICLIRYKGIRSTYRLGRVVENKSGEDGLVRSVRLQYKLPNEKVFRFVDRAVQGIAVIVPIEEQK